MPHAKIRPREGDILKDLNGILFDVKGLIHPPDKVVAFPRFIPDFSGNRLHEDVVYKKVYSLSERFKFLEQHFPQLIVHDRVFDEKLCEVPSENIKLQYRPVNRLRELRHCDKLDEVEEDALSFLEILRDNAKIPWSKIGVSGSLLIKLHRRDSDIDPIIYGTKNCRKVYETLKALTKNSESDVKVYTPEELQRLFEFRVKDTRTSFEDFVKTEARKVLQGTFKGRDYFMRFVKDWNEITEEYDTVQYRNVGYAKIKADIGDESESIFTPSRYKLEKMETLEGTSRGSIEEIVSFRGRFCEQARVGETVVAQGKVEKVMDTRQNREYLRLLIGNKPSDFMILA